jgi:hypothetical protein
MLSIGQQKALAVLPKITGFPSVLFSVAVVAVILRDRKKKSKVYHRLILGMSLADISSSIWLAMSTWPIPNKTVIVWAVGNTTSCTFQGFFTQFGISSPAYNLSLSVYYLLVVRYAWKEGRTIKTSGTVVSYAAHRVGRWHIYRRAFSPDFQFGKFMVLDCQLSRSE